MSKVIASITQSLDGYIVGPQDGPEHGLGIGRGTSPLLGHGRTVDLRRRRCLTPTACTAPTGEYFETVTDGAGLLRIVRPGHVRGRRRVGRDQPLPRDADRASPTGVEDQPDPSTGFLFVDGFDVALHKARGRR